MIERQRMSGYLKDKYGKDFVVGGPKREGYGLGVEGHIEAEAYPEDNKTLSFKVLMGDGIYDDQYAEAVWSEQEKPHVERLLKANFTTLPDFSVEVSPSRTVRNSITGELPTLNTAQREYPKEITYSINVKLYGTFGSNPSNQKHYDRIFEIIRYLQQKSGFKPRINYTVYTSVSGAPDSLHYVCSLFDEELMKVTSSGELSNCFSKRGIRG
jgi:hypothetical protein